MKPLVQIAFFMLVMSAVYGAAQTSAFNLAMQFMYLLAALVMLYVDHKQTRAAANAQDVELDEVYLMVGTNKDELVPTWFYVFGTFHDADRFRRHARIKCPDIRWASTSYPCLVDTADSALEALDVAQGSKT